MMEGYFYVHLVWVDPKTGSQIYLTGEEDITQEFIEKNDIRTIISVNPDLKKEFDYATRYHFPFHDASPSEQEKGMKDNAAKAVEQLIREIEVGHNVIVHCRAGVHRSPAVVYVALTKMGYFEHTYDAYHHVVKLRPWVAYYKKLVRWVKMAAGGDKDV